MNPRIRIIGRTVLAVGLLTLITGIVFAFSVGTAATPILLSASVLLNSAGITILRSGKRK